MDKVITIIDDRGTRIKTGKNAEQVISELKIIKPESKFVAEVNRKLNKGEKQWLLYLN